MTYLKDTKYQLLITALAIAFVLCMGCATPSFTLPEGDRDITITDTIITPFGSRTFKVEYDGRTEASTVVGAPQTTK